MPWRVLLTRRANRDIVNILRWTARTFGPGQVETYDELLLRVIARLETGPLVPGSLSRDEVRPGLRVLHVGHRGRHFLVYRAFDPDTVVVLRVLHDSMVLRRQALEDDPPPLAPGASETP